MNLVLAMDFTRSIRKKNIPKLRQAAQELVASLKDKIGEDKTRVAVIRFGRKAQALNNFNDPVSYDPDGLDNLIEEISQKLDSRTYIDRALIAANELFTPEGGARPASTDVLVLFTGGRTNKKSLSLEKVMKPLNVSIGCSSGGDDNDDDDDDDGNGSGDNDGDEDDDDGDGDDDGDDGDDDDDGGVGVGGSEGKLMVLLSTGITSIPC